MRGGGHREIGVGRSDKVERKWLEFMGFLFQGLLTVTDKYIYDELVKGKEDDSFYKG